MRLGTVSGHEQVPEITAERKWIMLNQNLARMAELKDMMH